MVNAPKSTPYRIENIFINHQTRFQGHTRGVALACLDGGWLVFSFIYHNDPQPQFPNGKVSTNNFDVFKPRGICKEEGFPETYTFMGFFEGMERFNYESIKTLVNPMGS